MRFKYAIRTFLITSITILGMRAFGVIVSDDATLISIAIMVAGALAGGD